MNEPRTSTKLCLVAMGLALLTTTLACEPNDETPGLWLSGKFSPVPFTGWGFTNDTQEIFIETRTWWAIPHSATIWCAEVDGQLFIGSYGEEKKTWERNVARYPDARLRVAGKIYTVRITAVSDPALITSIDAAYTQKYDMAETFGDELPPWWYYRVTPRDPQVRDL